MAKVKKSKKGKKPAGILQTGKSMGTDTKVMTPAFVASYVQVLNPKANQSGEMKYSISMIFDKDKTDLGVLNAAIDAAAKEKFGKSLPKNFKHPLRDGDTERDGEEYEGSWFINASSNRKPGIVDVEDRTLSVTSDDDDVGIYSGCICRASVNFFPFDKAGNKGVGCGLNNVQILRRGDRIDGGTSAEKDFDEEDDIDLDTL